MATSRRVLTTHLPHRVLLLALHPCPLTCPFLKYLPSGGRGVPGCGSEGLSPGPLPAAAVSACPSVPIDPLDATAPQPLWSALPSAHFSSRAPHAESLFRPTPGSGIFEDEPCGLGSLPRVLSPPTGPAGLLPVPHG